ncbi:MULTISPECIES: hypothetical protein [Streptomyces]|uniref:Uncharacterized protein n=1 Tax=Streptomyces edwardsiae TaxID=3075527 RepID=A0ABU2PTU2_9ACTN|nr:hypothetical protein [Streptomyces sp. DSM 41636]MDT0395236.1 hypothetical protein [Streptomyces sp. DSM 41636]
MNDRVTPAMHATPDGEAELTLVVRIPWEDVARLGQEAGRLAAQLQRPVTLEEAVGHRLRSVKSAAHARPAAPASAAPMPDAGASGASVASLPSRPPAEQARQAIERINGTA